MKRSIFALLVLSAASVALAQTNVRPSPPGEPPAALRNGKAKKVDHFDPKQMLRLAIGLAHPDPAGEEQFVRDLATPGSPNFRRFLTADQWNARFGPSAEDEQAVVDWAVGAGFTVTHRFKNRLIVDLEAPVSVIERALNVTINSYALEGFSYFSNEHEPTIPDRLSSVVHSIGGLNNFPEMHPASFHGKQAPGPVYRPGPVIGEGRAGHANADGSRDSRGRPKSAQGNLTPDFTNGLIDPQNIYSSYAYNYNGLQNFGLCCNPFHVGGGAPKESSIALATFGNLHYDGTNFTDMVGFHNTHTYLAWNITSVSVDGGNSACGGCGNDLETALDAEWSTATSNSFGSYLDTAQVWVYEDGGSPEDMYNAMLSDDHARTFSTSWSCTENAGCASGGDMDTRHGIFNAMAAQGWTLMTASGDRGATDDCSTLSVSYPASDPDVIGVGGTQLGLYNDGSFASEVAWTGGTAAGSCSPPTNNGGSGGGCSVHFSNPTYSNGLTPSNGNCGSQRSVPDISLNAASGQDFFFNGGLGGVGGTSISSPMLAGFFAQAESYLLYIGGITGNDCGSNHIPCTPIGFATPYIHYFGQNPNYPPHYPFYDITKGCNSNDITAANNLTAFCAGSGYDSVTGWGTANMLQFSWALNTYFAGSFAAPSASFSGPGIGVWHNTPQTIGWTLSAVSNAANNGKANGIAGYTMNWDSDPGDDVSKPTPGTGSNYYSGPAAPLASSGSVSLNAGSGGEGCHTAHVRTWDNGGTTADNSHGPVCFDDIVPYASCASPDGLWHATDVSLACAAGDTYSGLANSGDASFHLTTSVAANTETSSAFTNSRTVFDVAGNSTTRGPLGPNKVDKKAPVIAISSPTASNYTHSSTLTLSYSVTDLGSGVNTVTPTMDGSGTVGGKPITNGMNINLLTSLPLGSNTFAISATDNVSNPSSASVTFTIIVTAQSMIDDVNQFFSSGDISDPSVYAGLLNKLNQALAARAKGNCSSAANNYQAFINQVMGQSGKGITTTAAAILIADAQYLIAHCP